MAGACFADEEHRGLPRHRASRRGNPKTFRLTHVYELRLAASFIAIVFSLASILAAPADWGRRRHHVARIGSCNAMQELLPKTAGPVMHSKYYFQNDYFLPGM